MQTEVGVFRSRAAAEQAIKRLLDSGISSQSIIFLSGEQSASELKSVPTTEGERDGMGPAMGAVVGGAVGASAGLSLGTAIASLVVPVSELFSALAWARLLRLASVEQLPEANWAKLLKRSWTWVCPETMSGSIVNCSNGNVPS